ncbi:MAG: hypothetical protein ACR2QJ_12000 [Geminicoccaceae bacterium]
MLDRPDIPHWPPLLRPLAAASTALGGLAHALGATPIHRAWLWREITRTSVKISQFSGYRVLMSRLMQSLAGVPLEPGEDDAGLAAARRVFLVAAPLFRNDGKVDSTGAHLELFAPLWADHRPGADGSASQEVPDRHSATGERVGEGDAARQRLMLLVRELTAFAGDGVRPDLIDLFLELRRHAAARRLPGSQARLALPLALAGAGLVPKAAPGLLGGRLSLAPSAEEAVTPWLARGLGELGKEANWARRRLAALTDQHRAWHARLADAGLRRHSRAPAVLDLLAATPVLSASLVARHLGCSAMGASKILWRLADLGIVTEATPRARWKIYLAGDLTAPDRDAPEALLALSEPMPVIDFEAIDASLDALFSDLERLDRRIGRSRHRTGAT